MCPNNIFVSVIPLLTVNYRCYFVYSRLWYWRTPPGSAPWCTGMCKQFFDMYLLLLFARFILF